MNGPENDVPDDPAVAGARDTGGVERRGVDPRDADGSSTTGVDRNGEYVGRVAGDDSGYAGETGAERRAR